MSAPTASIETVKIVRPIKVLALFCSIICLLLIIVSLASTEWLRTEHYRQGLWTECNWGENVETECQPVPAKAWVQACAALHIIGLLVVLAGLIMTAVGLCLNTTALKFKLYRIATFVFLFAFVCLIIGLIVFPVMFLQEMNTRGKKYWEFAWAYGIAWGSAIFCFAAFVLLLCDKESEEIYYKEKTHYGESNSEA